MAAGTSWGMRRGGRERVSFFQRSWLKDDVWKVWRSLLVFLGFLKQVHVGFFPQKKCYVVSPLKYAVFARNDNYGTAAQEGQVKLFFVFCLSQYMRNKRVYALFLMVFHSIQSPQTFRNERQKLILL